MRTLNRFHAALLVLALIAPQQMAVAQRRHYGGFGGTEHGSKQCADRVVGIHGYVGPGGEGGTVVTQLGFTCANGAHELGTFGPPVGTYFQIDCNPGDAASGVGGRSDKYLDAIGLWCRNARGNTYVAPVTAGPFFGIAGGGGGSAFTLKCGSQGEIPLMGLDVWSGANVDGIEPVCDPTIDAMWSGHLWTWNSRNQPEDGDFVMPVRFTLENGQWKMLVVSFSVDIGEHYELEPGQTGTGVVTGDHVTLTLPLHGFHFAELHLILNLSTDATINPPGVPPQRGVPHTGNTLGMVGQGRSGSDTFWAAFRGTINAWPPSSP